MPKLKKRKNGYYEVKQDGKSYYGKTVKEARNKAAEAANREQGGYTFAEVSDAYLDYIGGKNSPIRRGTYNAYVKNLKKLDAEFGSWQMKEIDAQAVRSFLERMKAQGYKLKTITNCRSVLSCVFAYWCANMHGTGNPVALAGLPPKLERGTRLPPSDEQIRIINEHPEGCGWWAVLFKCTGIRIGEANALRWQDWNWDEGFICIDDAMPWEGNQPYHEDTKSSAGHRIVPILDELREIAFLIYKQHLSTDYVLSGQEKPLTQSQYSCRWTNYCRSIGLASAAKIEVKVAATSVRPARTVMRNKWTADVTAHQFRHLFATALFESGVPEDVAQVLLGHADIITTKRVYQHIRDQAIRTSVSKLNQYFTDKIS